MGSLVGCFLPSVTPLRLNQISYLDTLEGVHRFHVWSVVRGFPRFDSLLHHFQISSLNTDWAARSNTKQRAGRAGRVTDGVCFRMYTRARHQQMAAEQAPEMLVVPLDQVTYFLFVCVPVGAVHVWHTAVVCGCACATYGYRSRLCMCSIRLPFAAVRV